MSEQGGLFEDAPAPVPEHQWPWCQACTARHAPGEHFIDATTGDLAPSRHPAEDQAPVRVVAQTEPQRPAGALRAPRAGTWAAAVLGLFVADFLVGTQSVAEIERDGHRDRRVGYTDAMLVATLDPGGDVAYASIRARRGDLVKWGWLRDSGWRDRAGDRWWELSPEGQRAVLGGYRPPRPPVDTTPPADPRSGPD